MSNEITEQDIRERAYALWQEAGSPEGMQDEFWEKARHALTHEQDQAGVDAASEESFPASDAVNHM